MMTADRKFHVILLAIVLLSFGLGLAMWWMYVEYKGTTSDPISFIDFITNDKTELGNLIAFDSEADFKAYVQESQNKRGGVYTGIQEMAGVGSTGVALDTELQNSAEKNSRETATRRSSTNVQVTGIDEPDVLKTNGEQLFYAPSSFYYGIFSKTIQEDRIMAPQSDPEIQVINATPVDSLAVASQIDVQGDLLLADDALIVLGQQELTAFNVKDAAAPKEQWELKFQENTYYEQARLRDGVLYVIIRTVLDYDTPCPLKPAIVNDEPLVIDCDQIYHPQVVVPTETTYTVMAIAAQTGKIEHEFSFVGSYDQSTVYMSPEQLYIAHYQPVDQADFYYTMMIEVGKGVLPGVVMSDLKRVYSYDISSNSKSTEMSAIMEKYLRTLSRDDRKKFESDLENKVNAYMEEHVRELGKTHISRISTDELEIEANGTVPGFLLNQFSMDEYEEHLRVATTVGQQWGSTDQVNDLYVLDDELKIVGSVLDLGKGERVYSARFVEDAGYIVTFRETDPFYVFDLANPKSPKKTGELKIPGYSSYLHPLSDTLVLGVGREDSKVKLSLFSVADKANPTEIAKYTLNEYWSEALDNHHAFLQDEKHKVFFLPGGESGYVISYEGNKLELKKAVAGSNVKRAAYIGDYLYVVSDTNVKVLDESNWEVVKELELQK